MERIATDATLRTILDLTNAETADGLAKIKQNDYSVFMKANRPSRTAEYMALFRAVESAEQSTRRLFDDPYAISLITGKLKLLAQAAHLPVIGRLVPAFLDFGWPYTRSSGVVRTRLIDDLVQEAIRSGAKQFVLLGAGFDCRAYRLEKAREITTFEVDHPATQTAKRERLLSAKGRLLNHVRYVEVNFENDDLEEVLERAGFERRIPAVVVWEGVLSYLTAPAVDASFRVLAHLLATGSRLIFTYVDARALDESSEFRGSRRWKSWVKRSGEPFVFGFHPETLAEMIRPKGFLLQSDVSTADAAKLYCPPLGRKESGAELYRVATAIRS